MLSEGQIPAIFSCQPLHCIFFFFYAMYMFLNWYPHCFLLLDYSNLLQIVLVDFSTWFDYCCLSVCSYGSLWQKYMTDTICEETNYECIMLIIECCCTALCIDDCDVHCIVAFVDLTTLHAYVNFLHCCQKYFYLVWVDNHLQSQTADIYTDVCPTPIFRSYCHE